MIIFGWKFKPKQELFITTQKVKTFCPKHQLEHRIVAGKLFYHLYFIPLNFWTKPRVFQICDKCSSDYGEYPSNVEEILLKYYAGKISSKEINSLLDKEIVKLDIKKDAQRKELEDNFPDFIKYMLIFIGIMFILLLVKFIFF